MEPDTDPAERILVVVGVDGSDESAAALEWGLSEARLRGGEVLAVAAWEFPAMIAGGMGGTTDPTLYARAAEGALDSVIRHVAPDGVPIRKRVICGNPARVLLEAAEDADLLVVGSRGHGGFTGLLLGSVSAQAVHHSPCTTVVVRPDRHRARTP